MTNKQIERFIIVGIITLTIMLVFEIAFNIESVTSAIDSWLTGSTLWVTIILVWVCMFIQVWLIPIPSIIVINSCVMCGLLNMTTINGWLMLLVIMSADLAGIALAYLIGKKLGRKALIWCAGSEEECDKWSNFIAVKGKWVYVLTIIFPVFPDDILCFVCGATKMPFVFYMFANLFGRLIGILATIFALEGMHAVLGNSWLSSIAYGVALLALIVLYFIFNRRSKNDERRDDNGNDTNGA